MKIFLHVILVFFLLGCDESTPKSHNYLNKSSNNQTLIYPKEELAQDTTEDAPQEKQIFQNEQIINATKLQKREPSSRTVLSLWWILAIIISLGIIVYFIKLLAKKQKLVLDKLQKKFEDF